jgi:twitching motility two-component system response regulator PilH
MAADAVLVADPDGDHRRRLAGIVSQVGASLGRELAVHEAADGHTLEELLDELSPVLVLSEVLLDGPNGLALLRKLDGTEERKQVVWVFVTHMNREADKYWALRNGADAYVMRPYEDDALVSRIVKLMKHEREPAELGRI